LGLAEQVMEDANRAAQGLLHSGAPTA